MAECGRVGLRMRSQNRSSPRDRTNAEFSMVGRPASNASMSGGVTRRSDRDIGKTEERCTGGGRTHRRPRKVSAFVVARRQVDCGPSGPAPLDVPGSFNSTKMTCVGVSPMFSP